MNEFTPFWFLAGFATGMLALMQYQVWKTRRGMHNHMQYQMKFKTPEPPTIEEELADMITYLPIPAMPKSLQQCEFCGKKFKRVSQHIRMSHKTYADDTSG